MYRGSRLAASFLLVLTGLGSLAVSVLVLPPAVAETAARWTMPVSILFAALHLAGLVGIARARDWGRNVTVFVAELGGGLAILGAVAMAVGARPFGADLASSIGFVASVGIVYALLGIAAGRVPVVARLTPIERRRAIHGPSFAGMPHPAR